MTRIRRSALVRYTPAQMFDLVNKVEGYPMRFPWCADARVLERGDGYLVAWLSLRIAGMVQAFTTRNELDAPHRIAVRLVEGPLKRMEGVWTFTALGDAGCKVELDLGFEFAGRLTASALRLGFQSLADRLVDDFCSEAQRAYG